MKDPSEEFEWTNVTAPIALALLISIAGTLIPGIIPSFLLQFAQQAVKLI